ncbi:TIGR04222 domain-containing membrane protein [Coleofasciculus sp. FACHB-T130]|uniref:TIGR04222 domain-containing membrane protein n=1 Tax=Cyanophyceae TaxID=3028117 RepID=UPI001689DDA7|nr:TIGR04222 domain-containing membrane protein [Coleofasciculus sp. FACHB-T130]MBD1882068.1 TIGR04222 domain-containing membrane protein [Coleofasciculus sp. FACHB-T130]
MDMLLHNPIGDMYGPHFLLFYACVIVTTLLVCWRSVQDPSTNQSLPLIPAEPDPYEIAFLRGGEFELTKLVVFELIQRGYLQVNGQYLKQASEHPDLGQLKPIEREVFDWFSSSRKASEMKYSWSLPASLTQKYTVYEQHLQNEQLLYADEWKAWNINIGLIGATLIFSLGSYKLLVALAKGRHNVGFLIIMGVFSIIMLLWLISQPPRLSDRGQRYLRRLQGTFAQLKQKATASLPYELNYNLLVAVFGVEALARTPYFYYQEAFLPELSNSSSGRGSNNRHNRQKISSSSSSSSSCNSSSGSSCSSSCSSSGGSSCSSSCSSSGGSSCGSSCGGGCGGCGGG